MGKKIAFLFPGQGVQYSGMGKELYDNSPAAKKIFESIEEVIPGTKKLCFFGSREELSVNKNTQPCIFAVSLAAAAALNEAGIFAHAVSGFSLGEIGAAVYAGLFDFNLGAQALLKRAQFMEECAQKYPGSMAAVLATEEQRIIELCGEAGVYPVNFNCPGQITAAGSAAGIQKLIELAPQKGLRAIKLAVSGAFHCPHMDEASENMAAYLEGIQIKEPAIPLYSDYTGEKYAQPYSRLLCMQINNPVRWQKVIENMILDGIEVFLETGPGKTLSNLVKKINKDVQVYNVENLATLKAAKDALSV